jgi:hypothetical protein
LRLLPLKPASGTSFQGKLVWLTAICALYLLGQLLAGTSVIVAAQFTVAIFFGLLAVVAGGGVKSVFGLLNLILIGRYLLVAIAIKIVLLEPADKNLREPAMTSLVMMVGFLALCVGTVVACASPQPCKALLPPVRRLEVYLSFAVVLFVVCNAGYFVGIAPSLNGEGLTTGGVLGYARILGSLKAFAVVPAMFYAWSSGSRRFLTHPLVLAILGASLAVGIFSTAKMDAMEPVVYYVAMAILRRGLLYRKLWIFGTATALFFALVIFPYSQFVRVTGGREGSFSQRLVVIEDVMYKVLTDSAFRSSITTDAIGQTSGHRLYWDYKVLTPLNRFSLVADADRLISASMRTAPTEWETITWGFKLLTPSFLYPDKPIYEAGNYFGHMVGDLNLMDRDTQVSYGPFANWYNAFALPGVLVGTILLFVALYYWLRLFCGKAKWSPDPGGRAMWLLLIIGTYHHRLAESTLPGIIAFLPIPVIVLMLFLIAEKLIIFLPKLKPVDRNVQYQRGLIRNTRLSTS